jgi:2-oxoglutarate dehydrogenase E2 component (dihydrolipoamide succinyltransferase)
MASIPSNGQGHGQGRPLTKEDVLAAAAAGTAKAPRQSALRLPCPPPPRRGGRAGQDDPPAPDRRQAPEEKRRTPPLLTTFNDCDMSAVMEARDKYKDSFRKEARRPLGFMGFFTKAVALR